MVSLHPSFLLEHSLVYVMLQHLKKRAGVSVRRRICRIPVLGTVRCGNTQGCAWPSRTGRAGKNP